MDEIREGDVVKYTSVDIGSDASKYKDQFGFVNSVGTKYYGKVLYSVNFIDDKIVYGIPEDCIRKADIIEAALFRRKYITKHDHNLLDSVTLTAGKLYSDDTLVAEVVNANNTCYSAKALKNAAKSYGNKIEQVFFDEFVTEEDKENKIMYNIGDVIKYQFNGKVTSEDAEKKFRHHMECAKIVNYNHVTCLYTIKFADLEQVEVSSHGFIPATPGEICRFNMKFDKAKAFSPKLYECEIDLPILSDYRKTLFESFEKSIMSKFLSDNKEEEIKNMIKKVIFSGDRTVVLWNDGDKTIVKASNEEFDKEKGLAMAIAKKALGTNKNKSNYYDVFKKWIPEEEEKKPEPKKPHEDHGLKTSSGRYPWGKEPLNEEETEIMEQELEKLNKNEESDSKPWDPSMRHQAFKKKTREQISEEIVDKIMMGADTEDIKKSIEESKKIIEHEKVKAAAPKVTSYKPSEPSEMGVISDFVKTFKPTYFFKDFLEFCKNNGLAFITNDGEVMNPFEISLMKLIWLGRQKKISTVIKHRVYPGSNHQGNDVMAVDVNETLFQRLPREFRTKGQKEN